MKAPRSLRIKVAAVLYTPEVLGLTVELSRFPLTDDLLLRGEARSAACGSAIALGIATDAQARVTKVGIRSQACAIGQAAAAIFAGAASGRTAEQIQAAGRAIAHWLAGDGALPDWPGLSAIAAARDYPARHGAVMLPWKAAMQAFSFQSSEIGD